MKCLRILLTLTLLTVFCNVNAQQETQSTKDETLVGQFQELERKSGNYRANGIRYEVVKVGDLYRIKGNIFDSINTANATIKDLSSTITSNKAEIEDLNSKLQETTTNLKNVTEEKGQHVIFWCIG